MARATSKGLIIDEMNAEDDFDDSVRRMGPGGGWGPY
jgi:hypothetical protein